jgi:hypothetical protein
MSKQIEKITGVEKFYIKSKSIVIFKKMDKLSPQQSDFSTSMSHSAPEAQKIDYTMGENCVVTQTVCKTCSCVDVWHPR